MMRYKVKLEQRGWDEWKATLYEDPPNQSLRCVDIALAGTREDVLARIKEKQQFAEIASEPEWLSLDDEVPEPQSLKAV